MITIISFFEKYYYFDVMDQLNTLKILLETAEAEFSEIPRSKTKEKLLIVKGISQSLVLLPIVASNGSCWATNMSDSNFTGIILI